MESGIKSSQLDKFVINQRTFVNVDNSGLVFLVRSGIVHSNLVSRMPWTPSLKIDGINETLDTLTVWDLNCGYIIWPISKSSSITEQGFALARCFNYCNG